jgi:signal transduction protein PmrD
VSDVILKRLSMEWLVEDVIFLKATNKYFLRLRSGYLRMMAEVSCDSGLFPGETLYPVRDAIYLVNRKKNRRLRVHSASGFSATAWLSMKNEIAG